MRKKSLAIVLGLTALAAATAIVIFMAMPGTEADAAKPPADHEMVAHWKQHRPTLDQITEMLRSDPALNRLGLTWSDPADPERAHVPAERIADYRDLMREASIISVSRGHRSVQFLFHSSQSPVGRFHKSFVRGEASPQAEVINSDLDSAATERAKALLQRPIAEGWWLQRDGS